MIDGETVVELKPIVLTTCALDNVASTRVLEKAGFVREAILKNWVTYPARGGRAFDNYSYVRLPRDAFEQAAPAVGGASS